MPFFYTQFDLRQVSQISLLSLSPSSSGLPLFGVYTWLGFLHHTHVVVLLESGSECWKYALKATIKCYYIYISMFVINVYISVI